MNSVKGAEARPHHAISRAPIPALRPFVKTIWAGDGSDGCVPGAREHILPTGRMHLVIRVSPEPIAIWEGDERRELGHAVIGGARSTYYVKDISTPSAAVGAQLNPGAASLLFGAPADELAERHTRLDDVWGADAARLRDRLGATCSLARRLELLEAYLLERLPRVHGVHPALADALAEVADRPVAAVVERSGYSHRAFIELFRRAVGLAPKVFARVARFQRAAGGQPPGATSRSPTPRSPPATRIKPTSAASSPPSPASRPRLTARSTSPIRTTSRSAASGRAAAAPGKIRPRPAGAAAASCP